MTAASEKSAVLWELHYSALSRARDNYGRCRQFCWEWTAEEVLQNSAARNARRVRGGPKDRRGSHGLHCPRLFRCELRDEFDDPSGPVLSPQIPAFGSGRESSMMGRRVVMPAAWRNCVMPRVKHHGPDPGADSENAIDHSALNESLERRAQNLEEISEKHPRHVVGNHEHNPSNHRSREHLNRAIQKAHNRYQHEDYEETVGRCVSFERAIVEPGKPICRHQGAEHHHYEQSAGVESSPQSGTRQRLLSSCSDNTIDWRTISHGFAGWPSNGTPPEAGSLA